MRAVICDQPGEIELVDWPIPDAGDGLVLLKVQRVGLCGTDFHIYRGNQPFLAYPRIMGHELSGEVASACAGSQFETGDRVIVNPYISCQTCVACRQGKSNCCVNISVLGVHDHGGMCEFLAVPEHALYPAGNLTLDQGAMVEFLSVGAHAVRRGIVSVGQRVLVAGVGPIGLGTALNARLEGADVTVLDANVSRINKASSVFGFGQAIHLSQNTRDELSVITDDEFFDVVFDATGNVNAIEAGFDFVAHGGTYVLISIVEDSISFADPEFHKREMSLVSSRNATREDFENVIAKIENGELPTDELHTHSCSLAELPQQLPLWSKMADDVIKAIAKI